MKNWVWPLVIVGVALAASVAGIRNQFTQDDVVLIAQHARIHDLANWRELLTAPFWPAPYSEDLYRPLTSLLLAVEWALGGGSPLLFRAVSYLLYAGAALGVFSLGRKLLAQPLLPVSNVLIPTGILLEEHTVPAQHRNPARCWRSAGGNGTSSSGE